MKTRIIVAVLCCGICGLIGCSSESPPVVSSKAVAMSSVERKEPVVGKMAVGTPVGAHDAIISYDGSMIAYVVGREVRIHEVGTNEMSRLPISTDWPELKFSKHGRFLAINPIKIEKGKETIGLWQCKEKQLFPNFREEGGSAMVDFSPDEKHVLIGRRREKEFRVISTASGISGTFPLSDEKRIDRVWFYGIRTLYAVAVATGPDEVTHFTTNGKKMKQYLVVPANQEGFPEDVSEK